MSTKREARGLPCSFLFYSCADPCVSVNDLEHILAYTTYRANPPVGKIIKGDTRRNSPVRIANCRVVFVSANGTQVLLHRNFPLLAFQCIATFPKIIRARKGNDNAGDSFRSLAHAKYGTRETRGKAFASFCSDVKIILEPHATLPREIDTRLYGNHIPLGQNVFGAE
jgi:hypothetical protein